MKRITEILTKVYDNKELRKKVVPLFIGNPGLGKTVMIEEFAKSRKAKLVELITSQMSPFEISGIAMPDKDTKKMTYYNFDKLETLKDGDILFFDELLNGNPVVLNACLTMLEQRTLISGKKLPDIMIVAAANPQGMVPLTPQIKERFLWYKVEFEPELWKKYMADKYNMPAIVSNQLCNLIEGEDFSNNNFYTPRSIDKAISMISLDCPTPYSSVIIPKLDVDLFNHNETTIRKIGKVELKPNESINWLSILKGLDLKESIIPAPAKVAQRNAEYTVSLDSIKPRTKLASIKLIKEIKNYTIANCKLVLDSLPCVLASNLNKTEAEKLSTKLNKISDNVKIKKLVTSYKVNLIASSKYQDDISNYIHESLGISKGESDLLAENGGYLIEDVSVKKAELIQSDLVRFGADVRISDYTKHEQI